MKIKRRYKLILIILFAVILIISLYFILNKKKEVISLSIGDYISMNKMNYFYNKTYDNLYSKEVICKEIKEPYLTSDKLLEKITNNEDNIQFYIKNANFININVGNYELNNYKELNEEITIEYLNNMYDILYQITKINKANINLINIYDDKGNFKLINKKLLEYSKKFKINYIDLNKLDKSYFTYFDDKVYINSKGMYKINEILTKNS